MKRIHVASSVVKSVGYDARRLTMEVEFTNGSIGVYADVTRGEYDDLFRAESLGRYLNLVLKPNHPFRTLKRSRPPTV